jgi:hypothetical protein
MNRTKNGIPIATKPKTRNGNTYKSISNDYKYYATLFRMEDKQKVWLVMPFISREVKQLQREGWTLNERWEKGSVVDEN